MREINFDYIMFILFAFMTDSNITEVQLADELLVNERTIRRYIKLLKDYRCILYMDKEWNVTI